MWNSLSYLQNKRRLCSLVFFGGFQNRLSWSLNKLKFNIWKLWIRHYCANYISKAHPLAFNCPSNSISKKDAGITGSPSGKLREKHKGSPQKLNQEMMKFYKEHKVNPFAGCWPILIQIPIFLGMFWMLRSAAELYGQQFMWATDLSEQDNVAMLQGFSLNILPIFMVVTQWYQMRLNPMQLGPEMSEAQRINAKMMRFMPFMFLVFLYFFSSALVLIGLCKTS